MVLNFFKENVMFQKSQNVWCSTWSAIAAAGLLLPTFALLVTAGALVLALVLLM
jgi:hypothetical protein